MLTFYWIGGCPVCSFAQTMVHFANHIGAQAVHNFRAERDMGTHVWWAWKVCSQWTSVFEVWNARHNSCEQCTDAWCYSIPLQCDLCNTWPMTTTLANVVLQIAQQLRCVFNNVPYKSRLTNLVCTQSISVTRDELVLYALENLVHQQCTVSCPYGGTCV